MNRLPVTFLHGVATDFNMVNIFLFSGDDESAIEIEAKKTIDRLIEDLSDPLSLEIIREDDEKPSEIILEDIIVSINTPSFFSDSKVVWVSNISFLATAGKSSVIKKKDPLGLGVAKISDLIENERLSDLSFVISGAGIDAKNILYKSCEKRGKVSIHKKPEISKKSWRRDVEVILWDRLKEREMTLSKESVDYLIESIGADTGKIANEVEKLYCFSGDSPSYSDVRAISTCNREAMFYALANTFGDRNAEDAFRTIQQLMSHTKDPEGSVIGQVRFLARYFLELLQAKLLMAHFRCKSASALANIIQDGQKTDLTEFRGNVILSKSFWQIKMISQQAIHYTGPELINAVHMIAEIDKMLVSSTLSRKLLLEFLALRIIKP